MNNIIIASYINQTPCTSHESELLVLNEKLYKLRKCREGRKYYECHWCEQGSVTIPVNGLPVENCPCINTCLLNTPRIMCHRILQAMVEAFQKCNSLNKLVVYQQAYNLLNAQFPTAVVYFPSFSAAESLLKRAKKRVMPAIPHNYADIPNVSTYVLFTSFKICPHVYLSSGAYHYKHSRNGRSDAT